MRYDFLPAPDRKFAAFARTFLEYATAHPAETHLSPAELARLTADVTGFLENYDAHLAAQTAAEAARTAKDETRAAAERTVRALSAAVQADPAVTGTGRVGLGLPVRKTTRTPVGEIETRPVLYRVDRSHGQQFLWLSDSATPGRKAKPRGAAHCEIRAWTAAPDEPAPTDAEAMPFLASASRVPFRREFDADAAGSTAYYAQRWVNRRMVPGPWSEITGWLIL